MNRSMLQVATICCLLLFATTVRADSFFDVFFDITYDQASETPQLMPKARVVTFGTGTRDVKTEMLSMSLSSHRGMEQGSMRYAATVAVRSWVPNDKGNINRVDSFFDVFYTCSTMKERQMTCVITDTQVKTKGKHRGHVTVLK